jgi:hypothetical protein
MVVSAATLGAGNVRGSGFEGCCGLTFFQEVDGSEFGPGFKRRVERHETSKGEGEVHLEVEA